jgi:nucleoside-diphosphate-sugar epimerase
MGAVSAWPGMRAAVTGAAGFVGANLCRRLVAEGARVHPLVRSTTDHWRLDDVASSLSWHMADLTDRAMTFAALDASAPHVVFHCAVSSAYRGDLTLADQVASGVLSTAHVAQWAAENGARVVVLGSSLEYGRMSHPARESDPLRPLVPRGAVKAASTVLVEQQVRSGALDGVVLRVFSVYGPWEALHRLVPTAIAAALYGRVLPLTRPGLSRDLVFVDDVIEACLCAATAEGLTASTFNVGSGRQVTNEALVQAVEDVLGVSIRTDVGAYPNHPADCELWCANTSLASSELGWTAATPLDEGLRRTATWIRDRPEGQ